MLKGTLLIQSKPDEYPCLKRSSDGQVVLFTRPGTGLCVAKGQVGYGVGYYSTEWVETLFARTKGPVTIEEI